MIRLSILVPSIPDREVKHWNLDHPEVEILVFADNKKRTVGEKRQGLLDLAKGVYIMYLDDDDEVSNDFLETVLPHLKKWDAITFDQEAWINGKRYIINNSIHNEIEQLHYGAVKRPPMCHSIWKRQLAKKARFPKSNYGEDHEWAKQLKPKNEYHIDKVLHKYVYDDKTTATAEINHTMENKVCVISFASKGREDYNKNLLHLIESTQEHFPDADLLLYSPDSDVREHRGVKIHEGYPPGCPTHRDVPYAFKPYLFKEAYNQGYRKVLWMDSTMKFHRFPAQVLSYMSTNGVAAFHNVGHPLKHYMNNSAIEELGIESLEDVEQIMACAIGMDLRHLHVHEIFENWINAQECYKDDDTKEVTALGDLYKAHRHDQSILSWFLHISRVELLPYGLLCYPPHHESGEYYTELVNQHWAS